MLQFYYDFLTRTSDDGNISHLRGRFVKKDRPGEGIFYQSIFYVGIGLKELYRVNLVVISTDLTFTLKKASASSPVLSA